MEELDLRDVVKVIRKRLWWILLIVVLCTTAAGVISYTMLKPVYEASTKLIVNQAEDATHQQPNLNDINTNIKLIDTYKEIMLTPRILDRVIEKHPEFGLSAEQLANKLHVSSVNGTQVMTVKVTDGAYNRAADIANAVSTTFQEEIPSIMRVDNVTILNEAKYRENAAPVKPNPLLNIAIAFVVSMMAALGLAFLLEYLDDTIKSEADVEQVLGLPTVAVITKMKPYKSRGRSANTLKQEVGGKTYANPNAQS